MAECRALPRHRPVGLPRRWLRCKSVLHAHPRTAHAAAQPTPAAHHRTNASSFYEFYLTLSYSTDAFCSYALPWSGPGDDDTHAGHARALPHPCQSPSSESSLPLLQPPPLSLGPALESKLGDVISIMHTTSDTRIVGCLATDDRCASSHQHEMDAAPLPHEGRGSFLLTFRCIILVLVLYTKLFSKKFDNILQVFGLAHHLVA